MVVVRWIVAVAIVCLIFVFPPKVWSAQEGTVHYIELDELGQERWAAAPVDVSGADTPRERAALIFGYLFSARPESEGIDFVPEDTALLGVSFTEGRLVLNLSEGARNYGGCYYERCMVRQIVKTALDIEGVDSVTLLIEGVLTYLAEGTVVNRETDWGDGGLED